MELASILGSLGDYMRDAVIVAEAEPVNLPGPRVLWANKAFTDMTGYAAEEIIGQTPRILHGKDTDPETRARIGRKLKAWERIREEILNYRKDGTPFWVELDIQPVADETGWYHYWVAIQRDVTARKEAELALTRDLAAVKRERRAVEEEKALLKLQGMVAAYTTDAVLVTDALGRIIWANSAFEEMTGFDAAMVEGQRPGALLQGADTDPATIAAMSATIRAGQGGVFEVVNYKKDGTPFWARMQISPVKDAAGRIENFIAVEQDVTERKTNEERLLKSHQALQDALRRADEALASLSAYQSALDRHAIVAVTDRRGRITFVNDNFCKISGYARADLLGRNHRILNSGTHSAATFKSLWRTISGGDIWHGELCNKRHDGSTYWVDTTIVPLTGPTGMIEQYVSIRYEITDKKEAAERLRLSEERMNLALEGASDGVWDLDLKTGDTFYSPRNFRLLGEEGGGDDQERAMVDWWRNRVHPDDLAAVQRALERHIDGKDVYDVTYRMRHADGSWRWWRSRGQAVYGADGTATRVTGVNSDVTELKEALRQAEAANKLKSEFLATMSHEIRTPLNGILGMAQLLEKSSLGEEQRRQIDVIGTSGRALLSLITDVLDISKIESGLMTLTEASFDLRALLDETLDAVRGTADTKGLTLSIEAGSDLPGMVKGDAQRIRQILINLLGNAVKFTEAGAVALRCEAHGESFFRFAVTDTGPGIAPDQQAKIFERFRQADGSATRSHDGAGLGLAICRDFVRLMGGEIGVDSRLGEGACFWLSLPLTRVDMADGAGQAGASVKTSPRRLCEGSAPCRVLVAEDNQVNRLFLQSCLDLLPGVHSVMACNGAEAIEALEQSRFDLVLMDINMPVLSGEEAIERIRRSGRDYADIPIIVLTANAMNGDEARYLALGADAYLSKPIRLERLQEAVARYRPGGRGNEKTEAA